ncbi:RcnB family protein [Paracoccus sp. M683]|uniref:RcnB family protein n=1 Tax=Paracoccus sp. M683 TaxID=2594268 RepID=UPI00117ECA32|nr:RcnB family protein [Paracoccus sp. M683]TRW97245.1 RcnB family protein [Paracoccus sp. M683]
MTKRRLMTAALLGVTMIVAPVSSFAKENNQGNGRGHDRDRDVRVEVRDGQILRAQRPIVVANCPPGLAKKSPACVPPGQARRGGNNGIVIGDVLDLDDIHVITQPGLYGLGDPPRGNRYAIIDGQLVRVDSDTGRLLSFIRLVNAILD